MDHYITILLGDRGRTQQAGNALYFLFRAYLPTDVVALTVLLVQDQVWSDGLASAAVVVSSASAPSRLLLLE